jgi:hypothetical protein
MDTWWSRVLGLLKPEADSVFILGRPANGVSPLIDATPDHRKV